jgi:hypothetical protein
MEKYCSEDHKIANLILVFMKEYRGDLEKDSFQYKGKTAGFSVKEQWFDNNDALNRSRKYVKTFLGKYPTYKGKYGDKDPSSWINAIKITVLRYIGICLESNKVIKKVSFSPGYFAKDVSDLMTLWMLQNLGDNNYRICPVCGNFFRVGPQPGQIYCGRHTRSQIYYFQKKKREAGK